MTSHSHQIEQPAFQSELRADQKAQPEIRGYLEGYYGRLLSWTDRSAMVSALAKNAFTTYCYAPKEDRKHRFCWREPYRAAWHDAFKQFCEQAQSQSVSVVAGIAPGIDFDFTDSSERDFRVLKDKFTQLSLDGTTNALLLWDDIDELGYKGNDGISEGEAHALTSNRLADELQAPVWVVPRVYAGEIDNTNNYLDAFFSTLDTAHTVLLCGKAIVPKAVLPEDLERLSSIKNNADVAASTSHRVVLWDNFYANDYCPRQLFLGPWTGRERINDFLINPTGLPYTDRLLLDVVNATHTATTPIIAWESVLRQHGVPDVFNALAPYFNAPVFGDDVEMLAAGGSNSLVQSAVRHYKDHKNEIDDAIEICLWQWKSPLAREWYPFIMSLKHDLALAENSLPNDRVLKTQTQALASRLLRNAD